MIVCAQWNLEPWRYGQRGETISIFIDGKEKYPSLLIWEKYHTLAFREVAAWKVSPNPKVSKRNHKDNDE